MRSGPRNWCAYSEAGDSDDEDEITTSYPLFLDFRRARGLQDIAATQGATLNVVIGDPPAERRLGDAGFGQLLLLLGTRPAMGGCSLRRTISQRARTR